jgi:hypothetical protein
MSFDDNFTIFQTGDNVMSSTLGGGASPQIHLHITRDSQEEQDEDH